MALSTIMQFRRSQFVTLLVLLLAGGAAACAMYEILWSERMAPSVNSDDTLAAPSLLRLVAVTAVWLAGFVAALASVRFAADILRTANSTFTARTFSCGLYFAWLALIGSIPAALYTGCVVDAGRGGAVATALAVLGTPLAIRFARFRKAEIQKLADGHPFKIPGIESDTGQNDIGALADNLQKKHVLLAVVLGTLVWAYGDVVARAAQLFFQSRIVCNF